MKTNFQKIVFCQKNCQIYFQPWKTIPNRLQCFLHAWVFYFALLNKLIVLEQKIIHQSDNSVM